MKRFLKLYIILSICLFALCGCNETETENKPNNTSNAERMSTLISTPQTETEISTFTTPILDKNSNRVNNITLTCNKLNGTIVKSNEVFSMYDTIGEVSSNTGYKEADVLDAKGNIFKGYSGGNCQVSSTLYNALLEIEDIEILERHNHSKQVYYVEKDKDAAIDYNSKLDFKFRNNTDTSIKIYASNTDEEVTVKIMKIE